MHCLFDGRLALGLLAGLAFFGMPHGSRAAEPERVKFYTWDRVEIRGSFYPSNKGNKAACVMMLHALGGSTEQDGWADLAKKLQKNDLAVLTFDFRGHGESTSVEPNFWQMNPNNRSMKSYRSGKPREQISYKDFTSMNHWAALVDDIAAAKLFLDRKNDSGDCNSANVIVIGAESGGTLGAMWIWGEWKRIKVNQVFGLVTGPANRFEGQDIACAVYLSISPSIGVNTKFNVPVDAWLRTPVREKVPMYFLFGKQDTKAANYCKHLYEGVLRPEKDPKLKMTGLMSIQDTKLAGRELLGKPSLATEDYVLKYVAKVVDVRGSNPWAKRDADRMTLEPVPYQRFLGR